MQIMPSSVFLEDGTLAFSTASWRAIHRIEIALCFLEVRPYFFRSGYHWKTILQKCKRAPISGEQSERARQLPPPHSGSGQTNSSPQIADPENEISTRRHCPLCRIGLLLLFQNLPAQRSHSP